LCGLVKEVENLMELEIKFPTHGVMNVLGIVYPQYWLQLDYDASFPNHLQVFKVVFYYGKTVCKVDKQKVQMQQLLNVTNLDY
jgi:hypothetical protein